MPEEKIGEVSDFFARPSAAGIKLTAALKCGDKILIKGHTTNLEMVVDRYHRRQAGEDLPREYEVCILKKDKKTRVIINMNVGVITYRGRVASMGTIKDITERKRAEELIKASLNEKEVLLREIHHRVKNNMQIIASLLRLQSNYIKEEKYSEILKESQNRIMSMSLIHEKLYQSKDMAKIDFKNYIRDVTKGLLQSYGIGCFPGC